MFQHLEPSPCQVRAYSLKLFWYLQENISSKAHQHIHLGHYDQRDSKPWNQGVFSKHTLYIDSTSYPLVKSAYGEKTRRHPPVVSWAEQESCRQSEPSKSQHTNQLSTTDPLMIYFVQDALR